MPFLKFHHIFQIDLIHEAENLLQFGSDFSDESGVIFPIPILELCCSNVIVETYESGVPLSNVVHRLDEMSTESRQAVANAGVDMLLKMVIFTNYIFNVSFGGLWNVINSTF